MPDEKPAAETEQKTEETTKPAVDLSSVASKAEVAQLSQSVSALADTVRAALNRPATSPTGGNGKVDLPANFIQGLRQMGLTDADIEHNTPIIVPYLRMMLNTDGAIITGAIQQANDEIEIIKAKNNKKAFPDWEHVEERVDDLRAEARKQGRYLSPKDAYNAAVAADVASAESKIGQARERLKARSNADDVGAQNLSHQSTASRASGSGVSTTALTAAQLADMTPKERRAYYDKIGDLPIR